MVDCRALSSNLEERGALAKTPRGVWTPSSRADWGGLTSPRRRRPHASLGWRRVQHPMGGLDGGILFVVPKAKGQGDGEAVKLQAWRGTGLRIAWLGCLLRLHCLAVGRRGPTQIWGNISWKMDGTKSSLNHAAGAFLSCRGYDFFPHVTESEATKLRDIVAQSSVALTPAVLLPTSHWRLPLWVRRQTVQDFAPDQMIGSAPPQPQPAVSLILCSRPVLPHILHHSMGASFRFSLFTFTVFVPAAWNVESHARKLNASE